MSAKFRAQAVLGWHPVYHTAVYMPLLILIPCQNVISRFNFVVTISTSTILYAPSLEPGFGISVHSAILFCFMSRSFEVQLLYLVPWWSIHITQGPSGDMNDSHGYILQHRKKQGLTYT